MNEAKSEVQFDWPVYREATFAGLSVLIPLPMVDMLFERIFRARIAPSIARYRKQKLSPVLRRALRSRRLTFFGCLWLPFGFVIELAVRIWRTVLYFLTVKAATDQLAHQWRRAFLIDRMLVRGDLQDHKSTRTVAAIYAFRQLMAEEDDSPLLALAQKVLSSATHVLRASWRMLRRKPTRDDDPEAQDARQKMEQGWAGVRAYFESLGARYDKLHGAHWEALQTGLGPPDASGKQTG